MSEACQKTIHDLPDFKIAFHQSRGPIALATTTQLALMSHVQTNRRGHQAPTSCRCIHCHISCCGHSCFMCELVAGSDQC
ncbi:hypothetical protein ABBQ38_000829 [Trebouxia sp. C0009 RCD-2024]